VTFQLDAEHAYRYTTIALVVLEVVRFCWWAIRRGLAGDPIATETERLRLQINRLQQTVPSVETPPATGVE
jgi:hypothetical protein